MLWKFVSIALCIFLGTLATTHSLRCYVCNSHIDGNCMVSKPSERYLVNCTDATAQPHEGQKYAPAPVTPVNSTVAEGIPSERNYTFCRKNVVTISEQNNRDIVKPSEVRVVRSCGWIDPTPQDICKWASEGHYEMCTCTKDKCNSAPALEVGLHLFSVGMFLLICKIVL